MALMATGWLIPAQVVGLASNRTHEHDDILACEADVAYKRADRGFRSRDHRTNQPTGPAIAGRRHHAIYDLAEVLRE
jgi:hypothetical protein